MSRHVTADLPRPVRAPEKVRSERWYARRNSIVDTSARLFAARGYHATGLSELCEAVGLGRGALYHYIDSKENLLALIHDRVMVEVLDRGRSISARDLPPSDKLRVLGRDLVEIITSYPDHVWVFLHEYRVLTGERATHFRASRREYEQIVASILQEGLDRGDFRIDDVRLAALGWLGLHNYIYLWYSRQGTHSAERIADTFATIFLDGIHARPRTRGSRLRR
jgi:AcrR family transcriptional regulator